MVVTNPKKIIWILITLILFLAILFITLNYFIVQKTRDMLYSTIEAVPHNKVGLVLGTSKYLAQGGINPYFEYRVKAAVELYDAGKVDFLIASGDNAHLSYNEPRFFWQELIKRGVPKNRIYLDYAGFSTLDSVVRCKQVFQQKSFTIITQEFHNQRAVYIASAIGADAVGFNAQDVEKKHGRRVIFREYLAKIKALVDLHIIGRQPRFLGDYIEIPDILKD